MIDMSSEEARTVRVTTNSRWDLQRLREETQLQRLRARQEKQILSINQLKREDTPSILPNLEVGPKALQRKMVLYGIRGTFRVWKATILIP